MESSYELLILLFIIIFVFMLRKKRRTLAIAHHIKKQKKEILIMETLAKKFIDKECIIYTITSNEGTIQGIIREVTASGMLIEDSQGQQQAVNLEYVTRIREFPRNKKGKKKSLVLD